MQNQREPELRHADTTEHATKTSVKIDAAALAAALLLARSHHLEQRLDAADQGNGGQLSRICASQTRHKNDGANLQFINRNNGQTLEHVGHVAAARGPHALRTTRAAGSRRFLALTGLHLPLSLPLRRSLTLTLTLPLRPRLATAAGT